MPWSAPAPVSWSGGSSLPRNSCTHAARDDDGDDDDGDDDDDDGDDGEEANVGFFLFLEGRRSKSSDAHLADYGVGQ